MKIDRLLQKIVMVGIYVIPFIPLVVSSSMYFPFITGKNFVFRVVVGIIFAAWLWLAFNNPAYRPRRSWLIGAAAVFLLILTIADSTGINPYKSFWSNFERMEGLITHIYLFAYLLVATSVLSVEKLWVRFFNLSLAVSGLVGFYGLVQLAGGAEIHQGDIRLTASLGNAIYLAIYNVFHVFLAVWLGWRSRVSGMRWLYGGMALLNLVILYYTATRGAILGLVGGLFVAALYLSFFSGGKTRRYSATVIGIIILLLVGFIGVRNTAFVQESQVLKRFADISVTETTTSARVMVWKMAWQGFQERPVLGWGQENFSVVFNKYYDPGMYAQEAWFDRAHNVFFDWIIAAGLLGLLAYLSLYALGIYAVTKSNFDTIEKALFIGLLAAYFIHNIFVFDNLVSYLLFFSVLAYLNFRMSEFKKARLIVEKQFDTSMANYSGVAAAIVVLALSFTLNIKPIQASQDMVRALKDYPDSPITNLSYLKKAVQSGSLGVPEAREQLLNQTPKLLTDNRVPEAVRREHLVLVIDEYRKQQSEHPLEARYPLYLGSLLVGLGRYDDALVALERARELSPRKQAILFEIGRAYVGKKQYQKAFEIYRQAYELEPAYAEARKNYAAAALYVGNKDLADELLKEEVSVSNSLINVYAETKEYDKLITVWTQKVAADPKNIQSRISLAAAYYFSGDEAAAINEIEKAVVINPDFRKQANQLIGDIRAGRVRQ